MLRLIFRLTYVLVSFVETILLFRIVLSFVTPDMTNKIVSYVFYLSDIFASPFRGIVSEYIKIEGFANLNIETTPIVALVAYVILAFILSELVKSFNSQG